MSRFLQPMVGNVCRFLVLFFMGFCWVLLCFVFKGWTLVNEEQAASSPEFNLGLSGETDLKLKACLKTNHRLLSHWLKNYFCSFSKIFTQDFKRELEQPQGCSFSKGCRDPETKVLGLVVHTGHSICKLLKMSSSPLHIILHGFTAGLKRKQDPKYPHPWGWFTYT